MKGATLEQNEGIVKAILEDLANGMAEPEALEKCDRMKQELLSHIQSKALGAQCGTQWLTA